MVIGAYAQSGARTIPRGLDQLSQEAATIVRGHIVSATVEPHPQFKNLTTVVIAMDVDSTLKGAPSRTLQFRQYIWDIRDQFDAAGYKKGQELLLLLGPVSQYGLTSPVGLEQGRFVISRDSSGKAKAVNGAGNVGLFASVEQRARQQGVQLSPKARTLLRTSKAGPVPLDALEDAIRTFGRAK